MLTDNFLVVVALLLFIAVLAGKAAYRLGAPALLLFLGVGILFGYNDFINFNSSQFAEFVGMIALCIILYSGGMDTNFKEIRPVMAPGVAMATLGVILTALIVGGFIYIVAPYFGLEEIALPFALLLAATVSSTDSASVFSILRTKKQGLQQNLRPLLELESGSNDPMAYILTVVLVSIVGQDSDLNLWRAVGTDAPRRRPRLRLWSRYGVDAQQYQHPQQRFALLGIIARLRLLHLRHYDYGLW